MEEREKKRQLHVQKTITNLNFQIFLPVQYSSWTRVIDIRLSQRKESHLPLLVMLRAFSNDVIPLGVGLKAVYPVAANEIDFFLLKNDTVPLGDH